jgi:hypothetical protein
MNEPEDGSFTVQLSRLKTDLRDLEARYDRLADTVTIGCAALFGYIGKLAGDSLVAWWAGDIAMAFIFFIAFQAGSKIYKR